MALNHSIHPPQSHQKSVSAFSPLFLGGELIISRLFFFKFNRPLIVHKWEDMNTNKNESLD